MKLASVKSKITQRRAIPGLFESEIAYAIKEASGALTYTGPKISREVWQEVLAFFAWTYDTTHSECQVRLYVHKEHGWRAWAYPQEAQSGLSARELDTDGAKAQRAQFGDEWLYFGTVHHHCAISAFQSGTDKDNEQNQDGLHITVGLMGSARHDLHARLYLSGDGFEPDLSQFWDIGSELTALLPPKLHGEIAAWQMTEPAAKDHPFNKQWLENLLVRKVEPAKRQWEDYHGHGNGLVTKQSMGYSSTWKPQWERMRDAENELQNRLMRDVNFRDAEDFFAELSELTTNPAFELVSSIAKHHGIELGTLIEEWADDKDIRDPIEIRDPERDADAPKGNFGEDDCLWNNQ